MIAALSAKLSPPKWENGIYSVFLYGSRPRNPATQQPLQLPPHVILTFYSCETKNIDRIYIKKSSRYDTMAKNLTYSLLKLYYLKKIPIIEGRMLKMNKRTKFLRMEQLHTKVIEYERVF